MTRTHKFFPMSGACLLALILATGCGPQPPASPRTVSAGGGLLAAKPVAGRAFTLESLALDMQPIPAGTFRMGSPRGEPGQTAAEGPWTWVNISRPFWLGRTPVTHGQWRAVMGTDLAGQARKAFPGDDQPANFLAGSDDAVAMYLVSWRDAVAFCEKLNARAQAQGLLPDGYAFTLPTEAQWEYACRAGTTEATYAGPMQVLAERNAPVLDEIAWYGGNSSVGYRGSGWNTKDWAGKQYPGGRAGPRQVGLKQPNAWGLCDMLGNVYQWCRDFPSEALPGGTVTDPTGPASGVERVLRGGSWHSGATNCRAAYRAWSVPDDRSLFTGFRLALAPTQGR